MITMVQLHSTNVLHHKRRFLLCRN